MSSIEPVQRGWRRDPQMQLNVKKLTLGTNKRNCEGERREYSLYLDSVFGNRRSLENAILFFQPIIINNYDEPAVSLLLWTYCFFEKYTLNDVSQVVILFLCSYCSSVNVYLLFLCFSMPAVSIFLWAYCFFEKYWWFLRHASKLNYHAGER